MSTPSTHNIRTGDFLVEPLVTDTIGWYVVKVTSKSIFIVPADHGKSQSIDCPNGSPYPLVVTALVSPAETTGWRRCGFRKDGTFRSTPWGYPLRPAPTAEFDGETLPYVKTDYSF